MWPPLATGTLHVRASSADGADWHVLPRSRRWAAVVLISIMVSATACSGESRPDAEPGGDLDDVQSAFSGIEGESRDIGGQSGEIESITIFDPAAQAFLQNAVFELTSRCMAKQGFEWQAPLTGEQFHLGPFPEPEQMKTFGYGIDPSEWQGGPTGEYALLSEVPVEQREEWLAALSGSTEKSVSVVLPNGVEVFTSTEGCYSQSQIAVFGSLSDVLVYKYIQQDLTGGTAYALAIQDGRYEDGRLAWLECIEDAGLVVDKSIDSLRGEALQGYLDLDEDSAEFAERELAAIDAECLTQSGFHSVRTELYQEMRSKVADDSGYDLIKASVFQRQAVERAQDLLDE